jgi:hypothetical protein
MERIPTFAVGYYVVDEVGSAGCIAGPFLDPGSADIDRQERNIADDCGVWHRNSNGEFYAYPGYSLEATR